MALPLLTYNRDCLSYDQEHGVLRLLDYGRFPDETVFLECSTTAEVAATLAQQQLLLHERTPLVLAASYGLALATREHTSWTTDARRGALIQAAEQLRSISPEAAALHDLIDATLQVGDTALLYGEPLETAVVTFVDEQVALADTIAEACGRHAAALLNDGDCVLTHGYAGAALHWLLAAAAEQQKDITLYVPETRPLLQGSRLTVHQADALGVPVTLITDNMPGHYFSRGAFQCLFVAADRVTQEGSIAAPAGTYQYAVLAQAHQVPVYVLGYAGPSMTLHTEADLLIEPGNLAAVRTLGGIPIALEDVPTLYTPFDTTPPALITAIVTDRGCFAPDQMATYPDV